MTTKAEGTDGTRPATINRGDVFWIAPDDSRGPVPSYSHPHVVVQDDVFNDSRIARLVTSKSQTKPGRRRFSVPDKG
jgi:mRNA interferase MazF